MKAVIMAGGEGTRLRPITTKQPKPMIPLLDKPLIEYTMELLKKHGITDIIITLQYLPMEIINYFGNGSDFGVNIQYSIEEYPLGTAGGVKKVESELTETFIVISGDILTDIDLAKAVDFHKSNKAVVTVVLKESENPLEYGMVVTDNTKKVTAFLEKPSWYEIVSDKINTGIYIMEPYIFEIINKNQYYDFSRDLFPVLLKQKKPVYGYSAEGYWCDVGSISKFVKCQQDALKGSVSINIKGKKLREGVWIGEDSSISPKAAINSPAYIGRNCRIYEGVYIDAYTVVGSDNIIYNSAVISRSILFHSCFIGSYSEIKDAVLCNSVLLQDRSHVCKECLIGEEKPLDPEITIKTSVRH